MASRKTIYLNTTEAYDRWAEVYDSDCNCLQRLDDMELATFLPQFLKLLPNPPADSTAQIVDLGCGTGRNTFKLLSVPNAAVIGLDASEKMLDIARIQCAKLHSSLPASHRAVDVKFEIFDMLNHSSVPSCALNAHAVISTLVVEHVPLEQFFSTASCLLVPGGHLLVTNMHSDMGVLSQAGFLDLKTGEKIRPLSYPHRIEDVLAHASRQGFRLIGEVRERAVEEDMLEVLGNRAGKWIGVKCWFGMAFAKDQ